MTEAQRYFLKAISDYIAGKVSYAPDMGVDLRELEKIAVSQSIGGIIYAQCKNFLPRDSETRELLESCFDGSVFYHICYREDVKDLKKSFADAGTEMIVFKGTEIAKFHRVPELRTMGDLDILIHPDDRKKVHKLMLSLGYECVETGDAVWSYKRDVTMVEVHEHMIYERLSNDFDYTEYFDHAWDFAENGELSPNMQFIFLLTHTAKHILNCGSGFRPFLDMIFMVKNAELNWDFINGELAKIGLSNFAKVCFELCRRWFNVELPAECAEINEDFFADATEKAFSDGVFGFGNELNVGAYIANDIRRKGGNRKTAFAVALRKLFPKENSMAHKKFYSFLFRRKALRPIAWIYRIIFCTVTKFSYSIKMLVYPFKNKKEIRSRHAFLESWGL